MQVTAPVTNRQYRSVFVRKLDCVFQYAILTAGLLYLTMGAMANSSAPETIGFDNGGNATMASEPNAATNSNPVTDFENAGAQNAGDPAPSQQSQSSTEASGEPARPYFTPGERSISLKNLIPNTLHDQKLIWLYPFHIAEGRHFKHLGAALLLAGATAGLIALDPKDEPYFRNHTGFNAYKTGVLRGRNLTLVITMTPLATFLGGLAGHDSHAVDTALLAAEALADTQILSMATKAFTGRLFPSQIPPHGDFTHTWFKWRGSWYNAGSFPSGHAASAFAVATVYAQQYRHSHHWVPYVAYAAATFISLARLPDQAHFTSDLFAGAVMGYAITHFVVLGKGQ